MLCVCRTLTRHVVHLIPVRLIARCAGVQNGGEAGIDCGDAALTCPACKVGVRCTNSSGCASGVCLTSGRCAAAGACYNGGECVRLDAVCLRLSREWLRRC